MDYSEVVTSSARLSSRGSFQYADLHFGHVLGLVRYGEFLLGIHSCPHLSHRNPSILILAIALSCASCSVLYPTLYGVYYRLPPRPFSAIIVHTNRSSSEQGWRGEQATEKQKNRR